MSINALIFFYKRRKNKQEQIPFLRFMSKAKEESQIQTKIELAFKNKTQVCLLLSEF